MFCSKCGNPLNENDKFCQKCGTPNPALAQAPAVETPVYTAPAQPVETPVYTAPAQPVETPVYTAPAQPVETPVYTAPAQPVEAPVYTAPQQPVYTQQPGYVQQSGYGQAPVNVYPPAPKQPNIFTETFKGMLDTLKNMKNPSKAAVAAADKKNLEGVFYMTLYILLFAFANATNVIQLINGQIGKYVRSFNSLSSFGLGVNIKAIVNRVYGYIFGHTLGATLFTRIFFVAFVFGTIFVITLIARKKVHVLQVVNLVGTALLVPAAVCLLNFILGFIPVPFTMLLNLLAMVVFFIMLHNGLKKLIEKKDSTVFYYYFGGVAVIIILALAFDALFAKAAVTNVVKSLQSGLGPILGTLGFDFEDILGMLFK